MIRKSDGAKLEGRWESNPSTSVLGSMVIDTTYSYQAYLDHIGPPTFASIRTSIAINVTHIYRSISDLYN